MSPGELRRLAERKLGESQSLCADADRLRVAAAALPGLLEPLIVMSHEVWRGPAADEFEDSLAQHGRSLTEYSLQIVRIAGEFEDRASRLRREASLLREQATAAEATRSSVGMPIPGEVA
jgi:hypothetical protein